MDGVTRGRRDTWTAGWHVPAARPPSRVYVASSPRLTRQGKRSAQCPRIQPSGATPRPLLLCRAPLLLCWRRRGVGPSDRGPQTQPRPTPAGQHQSVSATQPQPRGMGSLGRAHHPMKGWSCHHVRKVMLGVHHPMKGWSCHHVMKVLLGVHHPMNGWSCHHMMKVMLGAPAGRRRVRNLAAA